MDLQPCFVLHRRPYRNSSLVLELLTPARGRVGLVARGGRRGGRGRPSLECFRLFLANWSGRGELGTLRQIEESGWLATLAGQAVFCGMYLNELLVKLLPRDVEQPVLFEAYRESLAGLATGAPPQPWLRRLELILMSELGFGLTLERDWDGAPIRPEADYFYAPQEGAIPAGDPNARGHGLRLKGASLLAAAQGDFDSPGVGTDIRRLNRLALDHLLEGRELRSRQLLRSYRRLAPGDEAPAGSVAAAEGSS